jgi:3-phosphoglycerate kinase
MKKWILLVVLFGCFVTFGEEVAPKVEEKGSVILSLVSHLMEIIVAGLVAVLAWFTNWIIGKSNMDQSNKDAIMALEAGVESAWIELGRNFKVASKDGKLTPEEKKQLREHAWKKAKEVVTSEGAKVLAKWGAEIAFAKIRNIVVKRNKDKALVPTELVSGVVSTPV